MDSSLSLIMRVITRLLSKFIMTNLGPVSFFLDIVATLSPDSLFFSQTMFAKEILSRADMTLYKSLVVAILYLTFIYPDIT